MDKKREKSIFRVLPRNSNFTWFLVTFALKNVIKRWGHRACFHATMLTNTVIEVTFVDLRAQQIRAAIFQCGALYHTEFDFLWLFIHRRPRKNGFKYPALYMLLINIFILKRKHILYLLRWVRYVSICSINFICQKSTHLN